MDVRPGKEPGMKREEAGAEEQRYGGWEPRSSEGKRRF